MRYDRPMPESYAPDPTSPTRANKPPTAGFPKSAGPRQLPSWLTYAALVTALVGLIAGVAGWFYPSTGPGKFSDEQKQEAKTSMCSVTNTVRQATGINTNMTNPNPEDVGAELAIAANARLALYGGGSFLREQLEQHPATPADLAKTVSEMSNTMQSLGINYLAGASPNDAVQQPLREGLKSNIAELDNLCQQ